MYLTHKSKSWTELSGEEKEKMLIANLIIADDVGAVVTKRKAHYYVGGTIANFRTSCWIKLSDGLLMVFAASKGGRNFWKF